MTHQDIRYSEAADKDMKQGAATRDIFIKGNKLERKKKFTYVIGVGENNSTSWFGEKWQNISVVFLFYVEFIWEMLKFLRKRKIAGPSRLSSW